MKNPLACGRSHDKKPAKSARNKSAVGRLIAVDPWGNGISILIAKGTDFQDPELVYDLQPKTVAVECLRLQIATLGSCLMDGLRIQSKILPNVGKPSRLRKVKTYGSAWIQPRHYTL